MANAIHANDIIIIDDQIIPVPTVKYTRDLSDVDFRSVEWFKGYHGVEIEEDEYRTEWDVVAADSTVEYYDMALINNLYWCPAPIAVRAMGCAWPLTTTNCLKRSELPRC